MTPATGVIVVLADDQVERALVVVVLFAVHKIRPQSLRFGASAARWLSLSLEIQTPQRVNRRGSSDGS